MSNRIGLSFFELDPSFPLSTASGRRERAPREALLSNIKKRKKEEIYSQSQKTHQYQKFYTTRQTYKTSEIEVLNILRVPAKVERSLVQNYAVALLTHSITIVLTITFCHTVYNQDRMWTRHKEQHTFQTKDNAPCIMTLHNKHKKALSPFSELK